MKWLKLFKKYQTEEKVSKICQKYVITNWSINKDGLVDVDGDVILRYEGLEKLPLKFGNVIGNFDCNHNYLTTLEGAPYSVGGDFYCHYNQLATLKGAPYSVGGDFYCHYNQLATLKGAPQSVSGGFFCRDNNLTTLEGAPKSVDGGFDCHRNSLTTLEGAPYSVGGIFYCDDNPLPDLIEKNMEYKYHILAYQEIYQIYNSDGSINEKQFYLMMFSRYLKRIESQKKINDIVDILNDNNRLTKSYKGHLSKKEILDVLLKSLISYDGKDKPKIISKLAETNTKNFERLKQVMDEIGEDTFKADLNKDMGDLGF